MRFQSNRRQEEPEINLIPLIDVMLVIIIFLMLTTTYARFSGMELTLPTAAADEVEGQPDEINIAVTAEGDVLVNRVPVTGRDVDAIAAALGRAAPAGKKAPLVVINADAKATHQRVIDVMQAAQRVGLAHITFATRSEQ
ncbi:biopolymer transporter ExbD [Nitrogeniibacter mangrovi]|uniref:Biopolymer transporter ExbD n=1 Tax=Nitrogeniibacter mangrovi TaxID=2016596 RepID=A0A6C1B3M2_9RHOO|nr:biopolymer transporter ExbD [Nitrogeniibacter mangrovi]QID18246.1 biopolymer transporter ExbD [Nitrogeniibacter mangrovi]